MRYINEQGSQVWIPHTHIFNVLETPSLCLFNLTLPCSIASIGNIVHSLLLSSITTQKSAISGFGFGRSLSVGSCLMYLLVKACYPLRRACYPPRPLGISLYQSIQGPMLPLRLHPWWDLHRIRNLPSPRRPIYRRVYLRLHLFQVW